MRRLIVFVPALLAAALVALGVPSPAAAQATGSRLAVPIDQTIRIGFGGKARDVVVGNPMIADVTLLESGGAIVLGREYGQTTVTAFDEAGRTLFSRQVVVVEDDTGRVALYRGRDLHNYVCADNCQRTPMPGEPRTPVENDSSGFTSYSSRTRASQQGAARP